MSEKELLGEGVSKLHSGICKIQGRHMDLCSPNDLQRIGHKTLWGWTDVIDLEYFSFASNLNLVRFGDQPKFRIEPKNFKTTTKAR